MNPKQLIFHDEASEPGFSDNAATGTYGDLLAMGVIDPARSGAQHTLLVQA